MTEIAEPSAAHEELEWRDVQIEDPRLSAATNQLVSADLRAAIGRERVEVSVDRPHPSRGESVNHHRLPTLPLPSNFILALLALTGIVVGAMIALTNGDWWLLPPVMAICLLATYVFVRRIFKMTACFEHPSLDTVSALEADGVRDPDQYFSDVVEEFTANRGADGTNHRTVSVEDDPGAASAEQKDAMTATSQPSRAVG